MKKKNEIKYGNVEVSDDSFDNKNALIRVSMMLPLDLVQELKRLSLTNEYGGKYQVLARDILKNFISAKTLEKNEIQSTTKGMKKTRISQAPKESKKYHKIS